MGVSLGGQDGRVTWLDLEGATNVRDVGGLRTEDGRTTRPGALLRADNLQDLTPRDVAALQEWGVRTVLDLRHPAEVEAHGPGPLEPLVEHRRLSLIPQASDSEAAHAAVPSRDHRQGEHPTHMQGFYVGYVEDAPEGVAAALRAIAHDGPVLVHCAAGKDRTGVVVALALRLAGVARDEVVADYLRSAERIEGILGRLRSSPLYGEALASATVDDLVPVAVSIEGFLDAVDERWGGAAGLARALGLTDDDVRALRQRLVD
jgi:protein-tyrosine phosphatase